MVTGLVMFIVAPNTMVNFLQIFSSWSSDFAIVIMFKSIYLGLRLKDFIKMQFSPKLRFSVLGTVVMIQLIIPVVVILLLSTTSDSPGSALSFTSCGVLLIAFLDTLVSGPFGEHLEWWGFR